MRIRGAASALLLCALLIGATACSRDGLADKYKGPTEVSDSFDSMMIAEITTLETVTLWRVGEYAEGPGRRPDESIAVVAANQHTGWAFGVDGDGRFESTNLPGVSPADSPQDAQAAVIGLIERATGRDVDASWVEADADTWRARASFRD
jgi:hypothetical protein